MHQANLNLIAKVAETLGPQKTEFYLNIQRYGNTSSASKLIAAAGSRREGEGSGTPVVMAALGAGLNRSATLLKQT